MIAANLWVFWREISLGNGPAVEAFIATFGMIPLELTTGINLPVGNHIPFVATIFTSMFLHGGIAHILGNMWFLWVFGDNVEDVYGHVGFFFFYLFVGVCACLFHVALQPDSRVPVIGASGAISGVLGAYVVLFPRIRVRTVIFIVIFIQVISVPAFVFLGIWFVSQLLGVTNPTEGSQIAFGAHVGGFVAGVLVTLMSCRKAATPPRYRYETRRVRRW